MTRPSSYCCSSDTVALVFPTTAANNWPQHSRAIHAGWEHWGRWLVAASPEPWMWRWGNSGEQQSSSRSSGGLWDEYSFIFYFITVPTIDLFFFFFQSWNTPFILVELISHWDLARLQIVRTTLHKIILEPWPWMLSLAGVVLFEIFFFTIF